MVTIGANGRSVPVRNPAEIGHKLWGRVNGDGKPDRENRAGAGGGGPRRHARRASGLGRKRLGWNGRAKFLGCRTLTQFLDGAILQGHRAADQDEVARELPTAHPDRVQKQGNPVERTTIDSGRFHAAPRSGAARRG